MLSKVLKCVNITPFITCLCNNCRADSRLAPNQWETALQCNAVSHWLGANLGPALNWHIFYFRCTNCQLWTAIYLWSHLHTRVDFTGPYGVHNLLITTGATSRTRQPWPSPTPAGWPMHVSVPSRACSFTGAAAFTNLSTKKCWSSSPCTP